MDTKTLNPPQSQNLLLPSRSGRRRTRTADCTNSPEFEFWMVRNPSFPQPNILSADELFVDGVLLPLHLLSTQSKPDPKHQTHDPNQETPASEPPAPDPGPEPSASITDSSNTTLSSSRRWKDIFRKSEKKNNTGENDKLEKTKKKDRKSGSGGATTSAELNINIWPFSRSRSAGNAGIRPKLFPGAPTTRKVNSAPCSRSNSAGESKSRKWPSSPGRVGVHIGRSSPVWQVRRGGSSKNPTESLFPLNPEKGSKRENRRSKVASSAASGGASGSAKAKVLNLNVPMCMGYRQNLSCRRDENSGIIGVSGSSKSNIGGCKKSNGGVIDNVGGKFFTLRSLFTKKSLVTSH